MSTTQAQDAPATATPQSPPARGPKLDERSLRRPEFIPGSPVTLADGQTWSLRRPVIRFVPDDAHDSGFQARLSLEGDDLYGELMKRRQEVLEDTAATTVADIASVELAIGRLLLLSNYDLDPEQLARLLQYGYDADADPEGRAIRDDVMEVALGYGKKSSPAGSGQ